MRLITNRFLITGGISFVVFIALAFTPLAILPIVFSFAATGWSGIFLLLMIIGVPFGGFVFLLITTPQNRWLLDAAKLAGFWAEIGRAHV